MDLPFNIVEPKALLVLLTIPPVIALGVLSARARPRDRGRITASIVVRSTILLLITLALAGLQWITSGGPLNVVFLVDESASVSQNSKDAAFSYVKQAISSLGPDDRAGVVLFGEDAIVDRAISGSPNWSPFGKHPSAVATNIADAIQVGMALFPEAGSRRLVLLTDGVETAGNARDLAKLAGQSGVQLSVVPLGTQSYNEVAVDQVIAPDSVPRGQQFDVRVELRSTSDRTATITLTEDGQPAGKRDVQLKSGSTEVTFSSVARKEGFSVISATVASVDDRYQENNQASTFTVVREPPRVLIIAGNPQDSGPLVAALKANSIDVDVNTPDSLPTSVDPLLKYDAVVLANASAEDVNTDQQAILQQYVRDQGRGLLMIGGESSFGAGGYLRSPLEEVLPVSMDVHSSEERGNVAMAFVVDKSGSMGRCHCGGPGASDVIRNESGVNKLEVAKEAIAKSVALLNSSDRVGVVGFDSSPYWLVNLQPVSSLGAQGVSDSLQPIVAQGETNLYGGLKAAADGLAAQPAPIKDMILLGDGWTRQGDFAPILTEIKASGINLTTIGVGEGPGDIMKQLADQAGGRYYRAEDVHTLPDVLLQETVRLVGSYYVEKPFVPVAARGSPLLSGIDTTSFPTLLGYNSTTLKPNADLVMSSPQGDPILAEWQYGLGRTVAWTSDAKGRWAVNLVKSPQFAPLMGRIVSWILPNAASPGLATSISPVGPSVQGAQDVSVRVDSVDVRGSPRNSLDTTVVITSTSGVSSRVAMSQYSPGVYQGVARGLSQGVYAVRVEQRDQSTGAPVAAQDTGLVIPYPSEFRLADDVGAQASALLSDVAQLGNGKVLDPAHSSAVLTHDIASQPSRVQLWPWLLLGAIVLFPLDVAVRRLTVSWADLVGGARNILHRGV